MSTATHGRTVAGMRVHGERKQILHTCHTIIAQRVAMERGSIAARARPFSVAFDMPGVPQDAAHGYDAIVATLVSKSALPAASGMIDACHIVDAMTLTSSPAHVMRDGGFAHFPAQRDHHLAMTMRTSDCPSHQRYRQDT